MKQGESLWEKRPLGCRDRDDWRTSLMRERACVPHFPASWTRTFENSVNDSNNGSRLPVSLPNSFSYESLPLPLPSHKEVREPQREAIFSTSYFEIYFRRAYISPRKIAQYSALRVLRWHKAWASPPPSNALRWVSFRDRGDKKEGFALMCPRDEKDPSIPFLDRLGVIPQRTRRRSFKRVHRSPNNILSPLFSPRPGPRMFDLAGNRKPANARFLCLTFARYRLRPACTLHIFSYAPCAAQIYINGIWSLTRRWGEIFKCTLKP